MIFFKPINNIKKIMMLFVVASSLFGFSISVYAENTNLSNVIIVVNTTDKNLSFSKQQIRHIYMGGAMSRQFKAVNLFVGNPLRINFNTRMVGLTESRIQAYWAQMRFTGRSKPPVEFESTEEVIEYLLTVEDSVAYLPAGITIPKELTIIALN
ncbi:hypothetical protein [Pseudoalteromonas sp. SR43-3]|uniref:hypothetical protein n=1 Tax=Pseudoalteromonas sp. SR43-3 TaxID=2760943 RepID=UPI001600DB7B|nr:hypothetical protein [Pseudoalteromonas sp. SR43-3]MBB1278078.1 hypothetical protein [Pseudoalteromonas sp. SR43-3]